jgi:hypothetical protein
MTDTYMIVDGNGEPLGMLDLDAIHEEGTKFAFALAAVCNDPDALDRLQYETLRRVGVASFHYIVANALRVMAQHILSPSFDVARAHGTDLRAGMRAIAEGRQPE